MEIVNYDSDVVVVIEQTGGGVIVTPLTDVSDVTITENTKSIVVDSTFTSIGEIITTVQGSVIVDVPQILSPIIEVTRDSLTVAKELPVNGQVNYNEDGVVESIVKGATTIYFNYDEGGDVISITFPTYTKEFIRDLSGNITGWVIVNN